MSLPLIFTPAGIPLPLIEGFGIALGEQFDHVGALQGEGRKRRVYTTAPRTAQVAWLLTEQQMADFDGWLENTLQALTQRFTLGLQRIGVGLEYWAAEFVGEPSKDPIPSPNGLWRVVGSVLLTGEPSDTPPETGALALRTIVELNGSAVLTVPNPLSLHTYVRLGSRVALSLRTIVELNITNNGAPASDEFLDERWVMMRYPWAAGYTAEITDDTAAEYSWLDLPE
jgi:hypothetical protein